MMKPKNSNCTQMIGIFFHNLERKSYTSKIDNNSYFSSDVANMLVFDIKAIACMASIQFFLLS